MVNGLLLEQGRTSLGLFDLAWIGVPTAIVGLALVMLSACWLLPTRGSVIGQLEDPREYSIEMVVEPTDPLVAQTIEVAEPRHLGSVYLIEIDRAALQHLGRSPTEVLKGGDRLVFVGVVDSVVELQRIPGLLPATDQVFKLDGERSRRILVEAVVSDSFPLLGRSIREGRFRNRYDAAVIAVARGGRRLKRQLGDIVLRPGDTLLLEARPSFVEHQRNSRDFYLVSRVEDSSPFRFDRGAIALAILIAMVVTVAIGWLSMLNAALLAAGLMLFTRCLRGANAGRSVDWGVLVTIAAAFGVGQALASSGLAQIAAEAMTVLAGSNVTLNLALPYLATRAVQCRHHQQRRCGADVSGGARHGPEPGCRSAPLCHHHRDGGLGQLRHPDRLPDQPDGLRSGRIPLHRLPSHRGAAHTLLTGLLAIAIVPLVWQP